jgi:hypothetical protein
MQGMVPDTLKHSVVTQPKKAPANAAIGASSRDIRPVDRAAVGVVWIRKADPISSRPRRRASPAPDNNVGRLAGTRVSSPEPRCRAIIISTILHA